MQKQAPFRAKSWKDYGISKNRYRELKYFSLQYDQKKKAGRSDPVAREDTRLIRDAAKAAARLGGYPEGWAQVMSCVAEGRPYRNLIYHYDTVYWCERDFRDIRRAYFALLNVSLTERLARGNIISAEFEDPPGVQ